MVKHVRPVCGVPGCGRALTTHNTSGVCVLHNHRAPYCGCSSCRKAGKSPLGVKDVESQPHPNLKTVEVPYATSNSGVPGMKQVTLPKAPWDR